MQGLGTRCMICLGLAAKLAGQQRARLTLIAASAHPELVLPLLLRAELADGGMGVLKRAAHAVPPVCMMAR